MKTCSLGDKGGEIDMSQGANSIRLLKKMNAI